MEKVDHQWDRWSEIENIHVHKLERGKPYSVPPYALQYLDKELGGFKGHFITYACSGEEADQAMLIHWISTLDGFNITWSKDGC